MGELTMCRGNHFTVFMAGAIATVDGPRTPKIGEPITYCPLVYDYPEAAKESRRRQRASRDQDEKAREKNKKKALQKELRREARKARKNEESVTAHC